MRSTVLAAALAFPVVVLPSCAESVEEEATESLGQPLAPVNGAIVRLVNACSGLALDVSGASPENGARVIQWTPNGKANQQWKLATGWAGAYTLVAQHSGKALDVPGSSTASGTALHQWALHGHPNQQWLIKAAAGGGYTLAPASSPTKPMRIPATSSGAGAAVQIGAPTGGCAERWNIEAATTAPAPPPPAPPPGEAMPVGDVTSNGTTWRQILAEDFTKPAALGEFRAVYDKSFALYPEGSGGGKYRAARTVTAHDGMMDIFVHNEGGQDLGAAGQFRASGGSVWSYTYGRFAIRFRADTSAAGYGAAFLLWPSSEVWAEGEIDFPEWDFGGGINLYHHRVGANPEQNYLVRSNLGSGNVWHVGVVEWTPESVRYLLDGVQVGIVTDRAQVASTPHNWVVQTASHGPDVADNVSGHLQIDWATAYAR